jgi:two-component system sensor histidine kinase HupT/HoxJ
MWIDVIRKMDNVYADLIASQVALEERNAALEQARTFLGSVLGAISDVLIVCDAQGTVEQVNPALVGLVGQDEKAIVGTAILSLFAEPHRADILETLGVLRRRGNRRWARMAASPRQERRGLVGPLFGAA